MRVAAPAARTIVRAGSPAAGGCAARATTAREAPPFAISSSAISKTRRSRAPSASDELHGPRLERLERHRPGLEGDAADHDGDRPASRLGAQESTPFMRGIMRSSVTTSGRSRSVSSAPPRRRGPRPRLDVRAAGEHLRHDLPTNAESSTTSTRIGLARVRAVVTEASARPLPVCAPFTCTNAPPTSASSKSVASRDSDSEAPRKRCPSRAARRRTGGRPGRSSRRRSR